MPPGDQAGGAVQIGRRQIAGNAGWLFAERLLRAAVGLPVAVLLTRHLGPESFGALSYGLAWVSIATTVAGLGLDSLVVRDLVRLDKQRDTVIATVTAIKLGSCVCTALLALALILLADGPEAPTTPIAVILFASMLFQFIDTADYYFQSLTNSRSVVIPKSIALLTGSAVKLLLVYTDASVTQIAWAHVLESALGTLLLLQAFKKATGSLPNILEGSLAYTRSLIADAWPLAVAAMAVVIYMRIDVIMLQQLSTANQVGVYVAAARLSEFWYAIPTVWVASAAPSLIAGHQRDPATLEGALTVVYRRLFLISAAWIAFIQIFATEIVGLLYGQQFAASSDVLRLHAWTSVAVSWGVASSQFLLLHNRQAVSLARTAVGLLSNVSLNFLLIPAYGAEGAAMATLISYFAATFSIALHRPSRGHAWVMISSIVRVPKGT